MSAAVIWSVLRSGHAYTVPVKGSKVVFSKEKGNVSNLHTYSQCGFVDNKSVDLSIGSGDKTAVLATKSTKSADQFRPASLWKSQEQKRDFGRVAKNVRAASKGRRDLTDAALARWTKISRVQQNRTVKAKRKLKEGSKRARK